VGVAHRKELGSLLLKGRKAKEQNKSFLSIHKMPSFILPSFFSDTLISFSYPYGLEIHRGRVPKDLLAPI